MTQVQEILILCTVAAVVILSACDSGPVEEIGTGDSAEILIVEAIPDTLIYFGDPLVFYLKNYFKHSLGGILQYVLESSNDTIELSLMGDSLEVIPVKPGTTKVSITAAAAELDPVSMSFDVNVLCPVDLSPTEVTYFPNSLGEQWIYNYFDYSNDMFGFEFTNSGVMSWEVTNRLDMCTDIYLEISESFSGTRRRVIGGGLHDTLYVHSWNRLRTASLNRNNLLIFDYIDPSYADSVNWFYSDGDPETITTSFNNPGPIFWAMNVTLRKNVGMVSYELRTDNQRSSSSLGMTLQE